MQHQMVRSDDVSVLIPTLNEEAVIGEVIDGFQAEGFENILVIDGHSTDSTVETAKARGVHVEMQTGAGKGRAVREALAHIDSPYVLMVDGDGTYRPEDAEAMLEPLLSGRAEHVIGNRFAHLHEGSMTRVNRFGNRVINAFFRLVHGRDYKDILSGYRAFTLESAGRSRLTSVGFGIETELAVECVKRDLPVAVVPVTYLPRSGASETNLHPVRDGTDILLTLYLLARTSNPLFFFGTIGGGSVLISVLLTMFLLAEWFFRDVSHQIIAVVAGFALLAGVQLIMFGLISDMIVSLQRDMNRRIG